MFWKDTKITHVVKVLYKISVTYLKVIISKIKKVPKYRGFSTSFIISVEKQLWTTNVFFLFHWAYLEKQLHPIPNIYHWKFLNLFPILLIFFFTEYFHNLTSLISSLWNLLNCLFVSLAVHSVIFISNRTLSAYLH